MHWGKLFFHSAMSTSVHLSLTFFLGVFKLNVYPTIILLENLIVSWGLLLEISQVDKSRTEPFSLCFYSFFYAYTAFQLRNNFFLSSLKFCQIRDACVQTTHSDVSFNVVEHTLLSVIEDSFRSRKRLFEINIWYPLHSRKKQGIFIDVLKARIVERQQVLVS